MPEPPRVARALMTWAVPASAREFLLGDLEEAFRQRAAVDGLRAARIWYWRQAARAVRHAWRPRKAVVVHSRGDSTMRHLASDLRLALRVLWRQPAYAVIAILSLTLAIAANGLVYGLVGSLVRNPFPFPEPDRLVSIGSTFHKLAADEGFVEQHSTLEIEDFRQARSLTHVTGFDLGNRAVSNGTDVNRVFTALVIDDPTPALGIPPHLGRGFTREELAPGGPKVAIISYRLWSTFYNSDRNILSRTILVNAEPRTVVGVTGDGPTLIGTDLWLPWGGDPIAQQRNRRQFTVVARLAPSVSLKQANAELASIAARTSAQFAPQFAEYEGWSLRAAPLAEAVAGQGQTVSKLLLGAGVVVLLVACANLTNLLFARLYSRRREMAIRRALGAAGWQVVRPLFIESLVVSLCAAAFGFLAAKASLGPVQSLLPTVLASIGLEPAIDVGVALYCGLIGIAAAVVTTAAAAWQMKRGQPQAALRDGGAVAGAARQRTRQSLIVIEMALAVVLLVGAGLLLRSYGRIQQIDPGIATERVLTMRLTIALERYGEDNAAGRFFYELVDRLAELPDIAGAAATSQFPPQQPFTAQFRVVGAPSPTDTLPTAYLTTVTPDYFTVLDIPLRHGRLLQPTDRQGTPLSVVVNETFMKRYLGGQPAGRLAMGTTGPEVEVVGVVADARNNGLLRPPAPEMFATIAQAASSTNQFMLVLRTRGEPGSALPAVRRTVAAMDPGQPLYFIQTMEQAMAGSLYAQRVSLALVSVFAAGALIVATIGVYGIVAFWVSARTREIGIRVALGASTRQVMRLVFSQTLRLAGIGLAIGIAGGIALGTAAESLLYATSTADAVTLGGVVALLALAAVIASYMPARRAMAVNPVTVLRTE